MLLVKRAIQSSRPDVRAEPQSQRPQVCSAVAAHAAENIKGTQPSTLAHPPDRPRRAPIPTLDGRTSDNRCSRIRGARLAYWKSMAHGTVSFYFEPASSTSSVAAIRDRHANGRHAPTPNARPYVAPKHYYAHMFLAASSQQPAATSQQRLPRSAPATPTAVTPQRPTVERQTTVVAALASAVWLCHSESIFCSCRFILAHVSSTASVAAIRGRNVNGRTDRTPNDRTQYPRQLWFSVRAVRRLPVHTGYPIRLPRRGRPSDFTS